MKKGTRKQAKGLPFYKLQGAGNDVIVFHSKDLGARGKKRVEALRAMAHRQLGVGTDQFVEVVSRKPLKIQIWNRDGSAAEMCANGTRSFLFLAAREGWIDPAAREVPIEIWGRRFHGRRARGGYEVCLGEPVVESLESLEAFGQKIPFRSVTTGNPHAVIVMGGAPGEWHAPADYNLVVHGPPLEVHPRFPAKANIEFVRRWQRSGGEVRAEVDAWERGAGATLSCGSGAVAVAAVLRVLTGADRFCVVMSGFELRVKFEGERAFLSGPCSLVMQGAYFSA